jgi:hypothetical protein
LLNSFRRGVTKKEKDLSGIARCRRVAVNEETNRSMFSASHLPLRKAATIFILVLLPLAHLPAQVSPDAGRPGSPVPDLAAFLEAQPTITGAINCQFPNATLNYKDWPPAEKKRLDYTFAKAWRGLPSGLPDPLPNALPPGDDKYVRQFLSEQDALRLYFINIGWSLAFEMQHTVSWTILKYTPPELAVLFDSRQMFELAKQKDPKASPVYQLGTAVTGDSLPAAPEVSVAFIRRHSLFGSNQLGTVSLLLGWCKGLTHFNGDSLMSNIRAHWHYNGCPPESRVISGTIYDDGKSKPSGVVFHFTAGCHGTSGFLRSVLRSINIPVENVHVAGHSLPYFPTLHLYMTHGDDPYNLLIRTMQPALKPDLLLIGPARYEQLFGAKVSADQLKANVGARPRELALEHLPLALLKHYLDDQSGGKGHADGEIAKEFAGEATVPQLEARNLWSRMDARIAELGGPEKVRALYKQLFDSTNNHEAE